MILLRKCFSLKCLLVLFLIFPLTSFADSTIPLVPINATATNASAGVISLSLLDPGVDYKVTCTLSVSGAAAGQSQLDAAIGAYCTGGNCCKFNMPCLNNLGHVGPQNGNGDYQAAINVTGNTTMTSNKVRQSLTNGVLLFYNYDTDPTVTLNISDCSATPITSCKHCSLIQKM